MWHCCLKDSTKAETAQRKELETILKEFPDISSDNVTLLIRYDSDRYIVFLDGNFEVDFEITDSYDSECKQYKERLNVIYNRIEELEHRPAVQYLSSKNQKSFVRLLGNALAAELDMAKTVADQTIQNAEQFLQQRTTEISRRWLLLSTFGVFMISWALWKYFFQKILYCSVAWEHFFQSFVKLGN